MTLYNGLNKIHKCVFCPKGRHPKIHGPKKIGASMLLVYCLFGLTNALAQAELILTYNTTNTGVTNSNSLRFPALGGLYDVDVNNDGSYELLDQSGSIDIDVVALGYTAGPIQIAVRNAISLGGNFETLRFEGNDNEKLISIDQWGNTIVWTSMYEAFSGCSNMTMTATDVPNVSLVKNFNEAFYQCSSFNGNTSAWDVSSGTNFRRMFRGAASFDQDISSWDVSSGISFAEMFYNVSSFDQDIGNWDVSSGILFTDMFRNATSFNQDISNWDVSNGAQFQRMFRGAASFNQDIGAWDVGNGTSFVEMFRGVTNFNHDISAWDVSNSTNFSGMFSNASSFNQDIGAWDVGNGTTFQQMFYNATSFDQDIGSWDVGNSTSFWQMFYNATSFDQDIGAWNVGSGTIFVEMFANASSFNQNLGVWNVSNGINFSGMFREAVSFDQDISAWNVSNGIDFSFMFREATSFNQDIGAWDVSNGTNFSFMFRNATSFNQDIGAWDVSNGIYFQQMFSGAVNFNQDIGAWDVGNGTNFSEMFRAVTNFNHDISAWDVGNGTNFSGMFLDASSFNQDIGAWDVGNGTNFSGMFRNAVSFNQAIGAWDVSNGTNFVRMFRNAPSFNQDIGAWDVGNGTNFSGMFFNANNFNQDIGAWDVGNGTNFSAMFLGTNSFNQDIGAWDVSNGINFRNVFFNATSFDQDIGAWDVSNGTDFLRMFRNAPSFNQDLGAWDVSSGTNFSEMFLDASNFNQDIGAWDVSNGTDFYRMFWRATSFDQDIGTWDIGNMTNGTDMLYNSGLSQTNWDATLVGWHNQSFGNPNVTIGATGLNYCNATVERTAMQDAGIFTFSGDIQSCAPGGVTSTSYLWYRANTFAYESPVVLDHAEDGDDILRWVDSTDGEVDATPTATAATYIANFLNFNPGLSFTDSPMQIATPVLTAGQADRHIVVVYNGASQNANLFFSGNALDTPTDASISAGLSLGDLAQETFGGNPLSGTVSSGTPGILSFNYDYIGSTVPVEAVRTITLNGTEIATENLLESAGELPIELNNGMERIAGGFTNGTDEFSGEIAEVVVYPVSQTGNDKRRIESYLGIKYGITLSPANYLQSDGSTVIWTYGTNSAYHNDMAGIFRDDLTSLDQRIGKSTNTDAIAIMTTADGSPDYSSVNNSGSRTPITTDRSGILWGNNNGDATALTVDTGLNGASTIKVLERQWLVQATNFTANVNLRFTHTSIVDGFTYHLVTDADGDFTGGATQLATAMAVENTLDFNGVNITEGRTINFFSIGVTDFDQDGIEDTVDLDDDNDGIVDTDEGAGDLDRDTLPNQFDLDADGDGCFDVLEAGFTDDDDDGYLGPSPVLVDVDGLVVSGTDGYTVPRDNDSNTIYDFLEAGSQPNITDQPVDTSTFVGMDASISVTATGATVYQWQVSTDGGTNYSTIVDGAEYSGTNTPTLSILYPGLDKNAYRYRALVINDIFACGTLPSEVAILTVRPRTVIMNRRITVRVNKN